MKPYRRVSSLGLLTCLFSAAGCSSGGDAKSVDSAASEAPVVARALLSALSTDAAAHEVRVIISFRENPSTASAQPPTRHGAIMKMQQALVSRDIPGLTVTHRFSHVAAVAGTMSRAALERLKDDPSIASIEVDEPGEGHLKEAVPAIGGDQVRSVYGLTGKGVRVAVLDTGIDVSHPDLRDAVVAQRCFTQRACPPTRTSTGTSAQDDHGHGSNVTGVIASDGAVAPRGFAPDAEIVAVKVNDQNNAGYESDWVAGLDWIYANLATLKVKVVNMSLGTNLLHATDGSCDQRHQPMLRAVRNLTEAGVVVFAATGNSGSATQIGSPACNTGVIAVGAVYDSTLGHQPPGAATYWDRWRGNFARCGDDDVVFDKVTCFTNSNSKLDMVAPGAPITSDTVRGRTDTYWGTSQASPAAAGVAALMLQCNPSLTPAQVKEHLSKSGVMVTDPKNGVRIPSIRALAAVKSACPNIDEDASPDEVAATGGGTAAPASSGAPTRAVEIGPLDQTAAAASVVPDDDAEVRLQAGAGAGGSGCAVGGAAAHGEAPVFVGLAVAAMLRARRRRTSAR
ncbi:MAG: S8 family serine peptidase [Polyangiales bacterium]